jgi:hypothetical protein
MEVIAFAREERMILYVKDNVEVACGPAKLADFSRSRKADPGSVFDSGGNLGVHRPLAQNPAFALALGAGIGDHASRALACGASTSDAEETLLIPNLSAALAGAAGGWTFSGGRTGTLTILAGLMAADRDFLFHAKESFLKFESKVFAKIGAALHSTAAASATAEHISETKEFAEDVAEILEHTGIESGPLRSCAAQSGVAVTIVDGSLFGVGQDGVGFADLFELLLRIRIIGIAVGMVLQRELAVRALEFDVSDRAGNAQNLVVVSFCVCRQKWLPLETMVPCGKKFALIHARPPQPDPSVVQIAGLFAAATITFQNCFSCPIPGGSLTGQSSSLPSPSPDVSGGP